MSAGFPAYTGAAAAPVAGASSKRAVSEAGGLRTRLKLWRCRHVGAGVQALGSIWVHGSGTAILGANVVLDGRQAPIEIHAAAGAVIELGDNVTVHGGTSIEAIDHVSVGAGSVLGPFVKIIDNNFHALRGDRNRRPPSRPVRIEDGVHIGERAILLPGAHLPAGARIDPGSVIGHRVPRGATADGKPAEPGRPAMNRERRVPEPRWTWPSKKLARVIGVLRARWVFRGGTIGRGACATGHVQVVNRGTLRIGRKVTFLGGMIPTRIAVHPGARVEIGDESLFNYGASIDVTHSLVVGKRCMFASMVRIGGPRESGSAAIVVGDNVWIAHGATVLPGVTIGDGSTVSAGSVVTRDVPPHSLALGNPARIIGLDRLLRLSGSSA